MIKLWKVFKILFNLVNMETYEHVPKYDFEDNGISYHPALCVAVKKAPARMSKVQEFLLACNERSQAAGSENIPKINLDHVTVGFARSGGGSAGQNANIVNSKFEMRFNVKNADWLSDRVKQRILQMERNRINKDGELVISSTRSRAQKGNVEDALAKLQVFTRLLKKFQEIIDAATSFKRDYI